MATASISNLIEHPAPQVEPAPIRVLALIPGVSTGSSMVFSRREIAAIQKLGVDIQPYFLHVPGSPLGFYRERQQLRRAIERFRPHVVHAHFGTVTALLATSTTDVPVVITFRGSDLNPNPGIGFVHSRLAHLCSNIASRHATAIVCVSEELRNKLHPKARSLAVVLPSGVDDQLFIPLPQHLARQKLGWPLHVPIALFNAAGRPKAKGLPFIQRVMDIARSRYAHLRLILLDGSVEPSLVPLYFAAADCLLLASRWEGSPTVVQEAMACNLPVVTVNVGDVEERLAQVSPSRIVARDPQQFANAVIDIISEGRRSNGRQHLGVCALSCLSREVANLYASIAHPGPGGHAPTFRKEHHEPELSAVTSGRH